MLRHTLIGMSELHTGAMSIQNKCTPYAVRPFDGFGNVDVIVTKKQSRHETIRQNGFQNYRSTNMCINLHTYTIR